LLKKILALLFFIAAANPSLAQNSQLKVGLVLDRGGKNDNSFNSAAYLGAAKAKKELGITLKYVEAPDILSFEALNHALAKKGYNLIIAIGFGQSEALTKVAPQFPNTHFAIIDGKVDAPNVRTLLFKEHEGSYLVGALAAMKSKTQKIGFVGGMDIPLIRRFNRGFVAGVHSISPQAQISTQYIGMTAEAWNNPAKAKEIGLSQFHQGADIIFVAAGASGTGVFDAADETKNFAIGVDTDQNWMKPGRVLTSMVKKVDVVVYETIKNELAHKFTGGVQVYGLDNNGIDYAVDRFNETLISKSDIEKLEQIKKDIIAGKIEVPDYYKQKN
jgi:basic membrane protein A and related proteins